MSFDKSKLEAWLKTRPQSVQKLAAEFPLGTVIEGIEGERLYLIGYTEGGMLIASKINPADDYAGATAENNRVYACAHHYRNK